MRPNRCTSRCLGMGARCTLSEGHPGLHRALHGSTWSDSHLDPGILTQRDQQEAADKRAAKVLERLSHATLRHEPFKSWRWWELSPRAKLRSITADYEWEGPTATTRQLPDGSLALVSAKNHHIRRDNNEDWGVYSYKTPALLFEYNLHLIDRVREDTIIVLGELENWGHVVEHLLGYRAQRVLITKLWVFASYLHGVIGMEAKMNMWKRMLETTYQCDVEVVENRNLEGWIKYYSDTHKEEPSNE